MADTAVVQTPRLIELIAWLSQSDDAKPVRYRAAAKRLGTTPEAVRASLDALLSLSGEHKDWLASLRVALLAEEFVVHSQGAFRRPTHFSGEEGLALLVGLNAVRGAESVAAKLAKHLHKNGPTTTTAFAAGAAPSAELENILAVARRARDEKKKLEISYCGPAREPARRTVHVHQIVEAAGRWYVIAWCEKVQEFRRFRAERILEARLLERDFKPQVLFKPLKQPGELLAAEETVPAQVAFSKKIARWLKERYPGGREQADGRYIVTFHVADPAWFVRELLQYGAEAEVLGPESLRDAVRQTVQ